MRAISFSRRAVATGLTLIAAAAGTLMSATPAAAAPTSCTAKSYWGVPGAHSYKCTSGTGYYRALAYCSNTPGGWGIYRYGLWEGVSSNQWSKGTCTSAYPYLVAGGYEKR